MLDSPGASDHFALAMIQLTSRTSLPELAHARRILHLDPLLEFKYHKTRPHQKKVFFEAVESFSFRVRAAVVNKTSAEFWLSSLNGVALTMEIISRLALRASDMDIANEVLIIDGATSSFVRALRVRLSELCRQTHRVRPFKKIVGSDSRYEDGLQLADRVVGAVRTYVSNAEQNYFSSFANKVVDLWLLPEPNNKTPPTILK